MSSEELRVITESARRATNDAREVRAATARALRALGAFEAQNSVAREEMLRRRDRAWRR